MKETIAKTIFVILTIAVIAIPVLLDQDQQEVVSHRKFPVEYVTFVGSGNSRKCIIKLKNKKAKEYTVIKKYSRLDYEFSSPDDNSNIESKVVVEQRTKRSSTNKKTAYLLKTYVKHKTAWASKHFERPKQFPARLVIVNYTTGKTEKFDQ